MSSLMAFIAPLVLAAAAPQSAAPLATERAAEADEEGWAVWRLIAEAFQSPVVEQVRIERRVTIRVAPLGPHREFLADLPSAPLATRFRERKVGKCVPVAGIAGVQIAGDDRLLLFMRDQRLIGANLEKACRAREFYSGFYIAKNGDGRLCVDRDMIHARSGASCSVSKLRQLVEREDD